MKDYFVSIILVSAVTAIASAVLPEGKGRLREQADFVFAVALLAVIILPITQLGSVVGGISDSLSQIFESDVKYEEGAESEWLSSKREEAFEEALRNATANKFGFSSDEVTVDGSLSLLDGKIYVTSLSVGLSGVAATGDNKMVKKYLSGLCGVECEVVLYP